MTPEEVNSARMRLTKAIATDDEDAAAQAAIDLLCGAAMNLAMLVQHLTPLPPPT